MAHDSVNIQVGYGLGVQCTNLSIFIYAFPKTVAEKSVRSFFGVLDA